MSARSRACTACLRRSWLLAQLGPVLDYAARDCGRMMDLLALEDADLVQALGGSRREELEQRYARAARSTIAAAEGTQPICRHDRAYPAGLAFAAAPHALHVMGGAGRLQQLTQAPGAAMAGSRRASDYGVEVARSLARGLAASGVTVAVALADGVSLAALAGALETSGRAICVVSSGLGVPPAATHRASLRALARRGCAVSELPPDARARRCGLLAGARIVVGLAGLVIVVEAETHARDLAAARLGRALGRQVAAVPGRVTSPLAAGPNGLLQEGAALIGGAADAVELLSGGDASAITRWPGDDVADDPLARLAPRLRRVLARVGAGRDTPEKLVAEGSRLAEVLLALSELELLGLLARGDGARYVPREPLPSKARSAHSAGGHLKDRREPSGALKRARVAAEARPDSDASR
jgi:DNA processing protein